MSSGPTRLLLVGFMGSGKSTVGRALAGTLGWRFQDLDRAIEAELGATVAEIFAEMGEERFRETEERLGRRFLDEDELVLATGGGWAAVPGRLAEVPPGTLSIWLRVSPGEAVRRARKDMDTPVESGDDGEAAGRDPALAERPLLDVPDPEGRARRLLESRIEAYEEADWSVDTDGRSPAEVTAEIMTRLEAQETGE